MQLAAVSVCPTPRGLRILTARHGFDSSLPGTTEVSAITSLSGQWKLVALGKDNAEGRTEARFTANF
jgi:hypothetical protein